MAAPVAVDDEFFGQPDIDLYISNVGSDAIWVSNGAGGFTPGDASLDDGGSRIPALGDVDGDGDLDVVIANSNNQPNEVWLNDGSGNFSDSGQRLGNDSNGQAVLGDVDGDGDLDAIFSGPDATVWLNDGSGNFSDSGQELGASNSSSAALGDVDGDGDLDLMLVGQNSDFGTLHLNDGSGNFSAGQSLFTGQLSRYVAFHDLDGDGDLDALVANGANQDNQILVNDGTGNFSVGQGFGGANSESFDFGDVDGDGDVDIFVANYDDPNHVWLNDGAGFFSHSLQWLGPGDGTVNIGGFNSVGVVLSDFDNDGDLDAFVANDSQSDVLWLNNGAGRYTNSGLILSSGASRGIAGGDLDGDGGAPLFVNEVHTLDVLGNDTDADGDTLTITHVNGQAITDGGPAVTLSSGATIALVDGELVYDPTGVPEYIAMEPGETDTEVFTYTINDGNGGSDTGQVTVLIRGASDGPLAFDDAGFVGEDGPAASFDVLANDTDPNDGQAGLALVSIDASGALGAVSIVGGEIVYDPNGAFEGLAQGETAIEIVDYVVDDSLGSNDGSDTGRLTITVTGANDGPTAADQADGTGSHTSLTAAFAGDDVDSDDDQASLNYQIISGPALGSVSVNPGGAFTFNPGTDFDALGVGETDIVTFTYQATDSHGATSTEQTVTLTITGETPPPPPPPPPAEPVVIEAETLTLVGYRVEGNGAASGGAHIRLTGGNGQAGTATLASFAEASAAYDVDIAYFDENDGASTYEVFVNGALVATWVADEDTGSPSPNAQALRVFTIENLTLNTGDAIQVRAVRESGEYGRVDNLTFTALPTGDPVGPVTDADAAANTIAEDAAPGTLVGVTAAASDPDAGDTVSYSVDDARFDVDAAGVVTVAAGASFDFETEPSIDITVTATSSDSTTSQATFTIDVTDVDDGGVGPVTDANAAANTVAEDAAAGTLVGITASAADPDTADTITYSVDDARFDVDAAGVVTVAAGASFDFETEPSIDIEVTANSSDGTSSSQTFTVDVTNVNEAPVGPVTDTDVAANEIGETATQGALVGITASASDPDVGADTVSYSVDDARFAVDAAGVVTVAAGASFDFETEPSIDVTVTATSTDGSTSEETFTVTILDEDEGGVGPVSDANAAANAIAEDAAAGALVGVTASASDPDAGDTVSYSVDDPRFDVDAAGVVTVAAGASFDFETEPSIDVVVTATSTDGSSSQTTFTIDVTNVDEGGVGPVTDANLAANTIAEDAAAGAVVGITASANDPDVGADTVSYAVDDARFEVDAAGVVTVAAGASFDFETEPSIDIEVTATSTDGTTSSETFTIAVSDVNEGGVGPVTDADATANTIAEDAAAGAAVGITATASDPDAADTVTYSVDDARFDIDAAGVVTVAAGASFDFETEPSIDIEVTANSSDGTSSSQTFTVNVTNVDEGGVGPVTDADAAANTIADDAAAGTLVGITAAASDPDVGSDTVSYAVDDTRFEIDAAGVVTVAAGASFDAATEATIDLEVTATSTDGTSSQASFAIDVTAAPPPPPPPPPPPTDPVVIEAETLTLVGYRTESNPAASAGGGIRLTGGNGQAGTATLASFAEPSGTYDVDITYFDENDGVSTYEVFVNGALVAAWSADENTGTPSPTVDAIRVFTIEDLVLNTGDQIQIRAVRDQGEWGRVDALTFTPSAPAAAVAAQARTLPAGQEDLGLTQLIVAESEDAFITGAKLSAPTALEPDLAETGGFSSALQSFMTSLFADDGPPSVVESFEPELTAFDADDQRTDDIG